MLAKRITDASAEQKVVREIEVFLHSPGVGTARAVRLFRTHGADTVEFMTKNPYRLPRNISGIGLRTAEAIAMKYRIEKTAMVRICTGNCQAMSGTEMEQESSAGPAECPSRRSEWCNGTVGFGPPGIAMEDNSC